MSNRNTLATLRSRIRLPVFDSGADGDAVLVVGTGRSGTTWLAELINHGNEFRTIFEPLHPSRSLACLQTPGRLHGGLRLDDSTHELVLKVTQGRYRSKWLDQYNSRFRYQRRLVKSIRMNLLVGQIAGSFPQIPIVLIVRNPILNSMSRAGGKWPSPLEYFDSPELRVLHPAIEQYVSGRSGLTDWQQSIAFWCIETYVALLGAQNSSVLVTSHEELIGRSEDLVPQILSFTGASPLPDVERASRRPSAMTRRNAMPSNSEKTIADRIALVEAAQTQAANGILADFGLDALYGPDGLPRSPASTWPALISLSRRSSGLI